MRRGYAALAVPLVSGALALVWWAPWSSSPDPIVRARTAFGSRAVVHVVARINIEPGATATRPVVSEAEIEIWYDSASERTHIVERRAGTIRSDFVGPPRDIATPPLVVFVLNYRTELDDRRLRAAGSAIVQNRRITWLRSPGLAVAIDPVTYQPLWLRSSPASGRLTQLVVAETVPYVASDFLTKRQKKPRHL